jgi:hypothetical protein
MRCNRCREAVQPTVAVWGTLAASRHPESLYVLADSRLAQRNKHRKQQALRRTGGLDKWMRKKTYRSGLYPETP